MLHYIDNLKDDRVNCYSVLLTSTIKDYLEFIEKVYQKKGGIEGQRSALKTKSAQRIRKRLIDDLNRGTVIPPIVLGVKLENTAFEEFEKDIPNNSPKLLDTIDTEEQVSIIDGMQRTTALREAILIKGFDSNKLIRLELWIAKSTNSLIYRMLVLNSGQIPWNIRRQLEVVFKQLKKELETNVQGLELFETDEQISRKKAGQFQSSQFIELFMLFGTKRTSIDIQEELAEEFARLDIIETSGNDYFIDIFFGVSQLLVNLDNAFSNLTENTSDIELSKFKTGKHIFSSQPARAGFIVAAAQEIFGLPGVELPKEKQNEKYQKLKKGIDKFYELLVSKKNNQKELFEIIDLPTLDEQTNLKTSKVGEFERNFFLKSFKTLFDLAKDDSLQSLTPCWRSSH
ncbi:hypothetical protein [uncultured Flavobacterium sp.]|uniref:hypothetical protein n=1 Tax=uncultured Flavobacterium sp. TaxID=165435 RepID=UPI00122693C7|nr:hypothetical protein [uncultured Flavobacterium sp.]THD30071.1 MAG: hypothetical protein DI588_17345 [Flavobacterium johnsoniae]